MEIIESFLVNNPCYKVGKALDVKGLVLHSVGCNSPNAMNFVKKWNSALYTRACVHGFIDFNSGVVYQTLPWDMRGWHSSSGKNGRADNSMIGVEMCEGYIEYTHGASFKVLDEAKAVDGAMRTYKSAVELYAMLCKQFKLNPLADGVILSHNEAGKRGIASGHVDPEHFWTGLNLPYTMDTFRRDVATAMCGGVIAEVTTLPEEPKKVIGKCDPATHYLKDLAGEYETIVELNIRTGAGTSKKILQEMPLGAKCKCYGYYIPYKESRWYFVVYNGIQGFVNSNYLVRCL